MKPAVYQVFDLFGQPVYFTDVDAKLTELEAKLDSYPIYEIDENFDERKFKNAEHKYLRQHYRHLLNQLYAIKGVETRIRGEIRFAFPENPNLVIQASVLQQLDESTLLLRYYTPKSDSPTVKPVAIHDVRILNLMFLTNSEPTADHITPNTPKSRHWRATEARTVLPMSAN